MLTYIVGREGRVCVYAILCRSKKIPGCPTSVQVPKFSERTERDYLTNRISVNNIRSLWELRREPRKCSWFEVETQTLPPASLVSMAI